MTRTHSPDQLADALHSVGAAATKRQKATQKKLRKTRRKAGKQATKIRDDAAARTSELADRASDAVASAARNDGHPLRKVLAGLAGAAAVLAVLRQRSASRQTTHATGA
jgi:hypothetical protein